MSIETNGDRLRSMNNEELARWICAHMTVMCCERKCPGREFCGIEGNGLEKWMKRPVEEWKAHEK